MSNLITRTLSGIVFVAAVICSALWDQKIFTGVFLLFLIIGMLEYYRLLKGMSIPTKKILGLICGIYLFLSLSLYSMHFIESKWLFGTVPLILLIFIAELYSGQERPFQNIAYTLSGVIYIALPFSLISFLFDPFFSGRFYPEIVICFFIICWMNDIGAYLIGTAIGKKRLFERISPKKSWEGSLGGLVFSIMTAIACSRFFTVLPLWQWISVAVITVVAGTYGDLAESMLKRSAGIKDSGKIMPGHGGVLDRFDAAFFAVPCVLFFLLLMNK